MQKGIQIAFVLTKAAYDHNADTYPLCVSECSKKL